MQKRAEAFKSIGEVASLIGVATHVLRYWETQFPQLKPMKRADGRRYYRPDDVRLVAGLHEVLRDDGLTIRGAKKLIARDRGETVRRRGAALLTALQGLGDSVETEQILPGNTQPDAPAGPGPDVVQHAAQQDTTPAGQPSPFPVARKLTADWLGQLERLTGKLEQAKTLTGPARKQAILLRQSIADLG